MIIAALNDTYLKQKPIQSSSLADGDKVLVKKGMTYEVIMIGYHDNHVHILLDYEMGDWYIHEPHWAGLVDLAGRGDSKPHSDGLIDWANWSEAVSEFFTVGEVSQWDTNRIVEDNDIRNNVLSLADKLDSVRLEWGSAIRVTSWYRPPAINRAVGGASNSQHIYGSAADVYPSNGKLWEFQQWLDKGLWNDMALGYGARKGFVHLDTRDGHIRWNY